MRDQTSAQEDEPLHKGHWLRALAEEILAAKGENATDLTADEAAKIVHELRTYQIELELQNEELRHAQEELVGARDRYAELYDFAPVGYVSVSDKGIVVRTNLALAEMLDVERHHLLQKPLSAFVLPGDQDVFYRHILKLKETRRRQTCQIRMQKAGGETLWVRIECTPVEGPDGMLFLRSAISDISERRRAENEIRQLAKFPSENPNPVLRLAADGSVLYANAAAQAVLDDAQETDTSPAPQRWLTSLAQALESGRQVELEEQWGQRTMGLAFAPVVDAGYVNVYGRDISERRRAEDEIRQLAKFPSENPNPVLRLASDGSVLYANAAAQTVLDDAQETDTSPAPQRWLAGLAQALESGRQVELEEQWGQRTMHLAFAPVVDAGYVNVYGRDITERRRAERERQELEVQVQRAQKLESLGVLAGGIAHDFNNLLMAVLGNADLALMDLPSASMVRGNLEEIKNASLRAADLARQMLAYSGKGRFVIEALDLSETVEGMAKILNVSVSKKALLEYAFGEKLPAIEADATQIRQIIMNLITNASEAIGDNSGAITVTTGCMDADRQYLRGGYLDEDLPPGPYVTLKVTDTGCGMDDETLARLFDPFFTTKFTGRGLGMSAVLGIIRGHRGTIRVHSAVGRGTTVEVLLPASKAQVARGPDKAGDAADWHGSGTVLLVDDEATVRTIGAMMLERLGLKVLVACDGREAVDVFAEHADEIGCVVLDLKMPRMDGEEAFDELCRIRPDVRVIVSSGYSELEVAQRFAGRGIVGFMQKPYEFQNLVGMLREAIEA